MRLPPGAGVWRSAGYDAAWTPEGHLIAQAVDVLQAANWQRGGGQGRKPDPVKRPGDETRKAARRDEMHQRAMKFRTKHHQEVS